MTNRVGQRLGNYHLLRLLGQGGFAEVYLGEHVFLGTQAAIKVLQVRLAQDERESFLNEARTIAGLSHPNILRVLEFGIDDQVPFLVLEHAPNGTLRQRYPRGSVFPLRTILPYVKQIAAALQYLHNKKLIHRDIKPENLLLGPDDKVLLSDFGTALVVQTLHNQSTLAMAGTVAYMAPEQIRGKPRPASDQYGLAVVVYEWLCGNPPFTGSFIALSSQHMLAVPPSLRGLVPTIPYDVEQVVMTALAKDPEQRFASVWAFANALEQASKPEAGATLPSSALVLPTSSFLTPTFRSSPLVEEGSPTLAPSISESTSTWVNARSPYEQPLPIVSTPEASQPLAPALSRPGTQSGHRLSRRTAVVGLLGLGAVVTAGGVAGWLVYSTRKPAPAGFSKPVTGTTFLTYKEHAKVYAVAWAPGGQYIASGGDDHKAQVWSLTPASESPFFTYIGHSGSVNALAWSPDGRRLASASSDKTVQVWEALTGNNRLVYRQHTSWVRTVAWSPNGKYIASGGEDTTVQVWNADTRQPFIIYTRHSKQLWAIAWSPDGKYIASGGDDSTVQVWEVATGNTLVTYHKHSRAVKAVAWSSDGQHIASGGEDNTVQVWEAATGNTLVRYTDHSSAIYAVAWSPDGKYIASSAWGEVRVWKPSPPSWQNSYTYTDQSNIAVHGVAWSPDGQRIASGAEDETVRVWQAL